MRAAPVPVFRTIDLEQLAESDPCEDTIRLGSFWPGRDDFESRLVKAFKECYPAARFDPHITRICRFYSGLICSRVRHLKIDWVARVLSSAELRPDPSRPQSLLLKTLCAEIGARDATSVFFKSESRPPMRAVDALSGRSALTTRLRYVSQDLFVTSANLGGRVLLVDDIANTSASARVYAGALREFAGADSVLVVNLAATRYLGGKDGLGMLRLQTNGLQDEPFLAERLLDSQGTYHLRDDCTSTDGKTTRKFAFQVEGRAAACASCAAESVEKESLLRRLLNWASSAGK